MRMLTSSFEIERATPDQRRAARFVELLRLADDREFFDKPSLIEPRMCTLKLLGETDDYLLNKMHQYFTKN